MSWLAGSQNRMHHCDTEAEATHFEKKKKCGMIQILQPSHFDDVTSV
jgi:hypothetical protein